MSNGPIAPANFQFVSGASSSDAHSRANDNKSNVFVFGTGGTSSSSGSFFDFSPCDQETWCQTTWIKTKAKQMWIVDDFESLLRRADEKTSLTSTMFTIRAGKDELNFQLKLYPKGDPYDEYVAVGFRSLCNYSFRESGKEISFRFELLKKESESLSTTKIPPRPLDYSLITPWQRFVPEFYGEEKKVLNVFKRADLFRISDAVMPKGKLSLMCQVTFLVPTTANISNPSTKDATFVSLPKQASLSQDIANFSKNGQFTDFDIVCKEKRFGVHRAILAARSEVFLAMFSHEKMKENADRQMNLDDVEPEVMEKFLEYIYTDKVTNLFDFAEDLYVLADRYNLKELRDMCCKTLMESISVVSAGKILRLAFLHEDEELKHFAMDFIVRNMNAVLETDAWKIIEDFHPKLMREILEREFSTSKILSN